MPKPRKKKSLSLHRGFLRKVTLAKVMTREQNNSLRLGTDFPGIHLSSKQQPSSFHIAITENLTGPGTFDCHSRRFSSASFCANDVHNGRVGKNLPLAAAGRKIALRAVRLSQEVLTSGARRLLSTFVNSCLAALVEAAAREPRNRIATQWKQAPWPPPIHSAQIRSESDRDPLIVRR